MTIDQAKKYKVWAVLGATARKEKFGYKIYKHMKDMGYRVYAVNPNVKEIDGDPCYTSLSQVPDTLDMVDFVVPERVGKEAVSECKQLGVKGLWLQPGADKPSVVAEADTLGMPYIKDCVLVQIKTPYKA
ncbi:MAG: CoA-binding protein [Veillonellaceae bacterium]|nr:CoA-binding protein [Veillonellaceae bacterium]